MVIIMIILDTDIMIDILRKFDNALKWLKSIGNEQIILPGFVMAELLQGCNNKIELNK